MGDVAKCLQISRLDDYYAEYNNLDTVDSVMVGCQVWDAVNGFSLNSWPYTGGSQLMSSSSQTLLALTLFSFFIL